MVAMIAGIALMGTAAMGLIGLVTSKGCFGRSLLRVYTVIMFLVMVVFFAVGGAIIFATKTMVRGPRAGNAGGGQAGRRGRRRRCLRCLRKGGPCTSFADALPSPVIPARPRVSGAARGHHQ